jgi:hypothetical protein
MSTYAIDFKGRKNLIAYEIPSAVGMIGFYIPDLDGDYDFFEYRWRGMLDRHEARPCSRWAVRECAA